MSSNPYELLSVDSFSEDSIETWIKVLILDIPHETDPGFPKSLKRLVFKAYGRAYRDIHLKENTFVYDKISKFITSNEDKVNTEILRRIATLGEKYSSEFNVISKQKHIDKTHMLSLLRIFEADNLKDLLKELTRAREHFSWSSTDILNVIKKIKLHRQDTSPNSLILFESGNIYLKASASAYLKSIDADAETDYNNISSTIIRGITSLNIIAATIMLGFGLSKSARGYSLLSLLLIITTLESQKRDYSKFFDTSIALNIASIASKKSVRTQYKNRDVIVSNIKKHAEKLYMDGSSLLHHEVANQCYEKFVAPEIAKLRDELGSKGYSDDTISEKVTEFTRRHVPSLSSVKKVVGEIAKPYGKLYNPGKINSAL